MAEGDPDMEDRSIAHARMIAAFSVHVFTASGAALGFLALVAAAQQDWALMFLWLGLSLIVDGVDGAMARYLKVAKVLPRWSGETLDLVVDFVTYVFVPAYAVTASGLLPSPLGVLAGVAIVVTSALYFADRQMKMADNYFRGFPAVWSLVAFYLLLVRPDAWITGIAVVVLLVMTFVPVPFVHPMRVARLRGLSVVLVIAWAALALLTLWEAMRPGVWVMASLCAIGLYFLCAGLLRRADDEGGGF